MKKASDELKAAQDQALERRRLLKSGRVRLVPERPQPAPEQEPTRREAAPQPEDDD